MFMSQIVLYLLYSALALWEGNPTVTRGFNSEITNHGDFDLIYAVSMNEFYTNNWMGKTWHCAITRYDNFTEIGRKKICSTITEIHFSAMDPPASGEGQVTVVLHHYKSRQCYRALNRNKFVQWSHSYTFLKVHTPLVLDFRVLVLVSSPMGKPFWTNGKITVALYNYRYRQNPSSDFKDMCSEICSTIWYEILCPGTEENHVTFWVLTNCEHYVKVSTYA